MRLSVRHTTLYEFAAPVRFVAQSHRLTPASSGGQTVLDWQVSAEGAVFGSAFVDGAGDAVSTMTVQGPVERIAVLVEGTVETTDTTGVLRDHRETISPRVYLRPTRAIELSRGLLELRDAALARVAADRALERAHRLAGAVADAIAYVPGATHAHTTAGEALEQGEGVCQDLAHALIAVAHASGIPARYVTGYLFTGGDAGEAAHAWAELNVGDLGWVGFDPANRCCPDARYIRLGSGRDARDAAPIRGVARGGAAEAMDVSVLIDAQQ
ncbi:transglutaminase family protein [Amaricoccus sp.]|mgnify:CR=1 FL=1|uniref:transglutaminase family protein n=1 Tax=Amaricoccus sp. TaxID=1872485 RepID=UPI00260D53CC|nr:transglutaminase family protein [Amaricoccus sp.]HRO12648.1 transglutaminase family protein [Amaricoccus sp.]